MLDNQVLLGNGTSAIDKVSGLGDSGQFLTSNGAGTPPTWQTSAVDESLDYHWTGYHEFDDASIASSTITTLKGTTATLTNIISSGTQTLNGIAYTFPATESASSTVLSTDGSGSLTWKTEETFGTTASDTLQASADTENTSAALPSGQEEFMDKRITVRLPGIVRVTYESYSVQSGAGYEIRDENGAVLATDTQVTVGSYVTKTNDIYVQAGMNIKLYFLSNTSNTTASVKNFRVKFTKGTITDVSVITN